MILIKNATHNSNYCKYKLFEGIKQKQPSFFTAQLYIVGFPISEAWAIKKNTQVINFALVT